MALFWNMLPAHSSAPIMVKATAHGAPKRLGSQVENSSPPRIMPPQNPATAFCREKDTMPSPRPSRKITNWAASRLAMPMPEMTGNPFLPDSIGSPKCQRGLSSDSQLQLHYPLKEHHIYYGSIANSYTCYSILIASFHLALAESCPKAFFSVRPQ